ncbi:MAG: O-antigen ligase family protein [Planctomycetaceae bacterium]
MIGNFEGWVLSVVLIAVVGRYLLIRKGPAAARGAAMMLSFAFPVGIKIDIGGLPISIRTAIAGITLFGYAVHPQGKILSPLTLLDCCIAMFYLVHIVADSFATGFTIMLPFRSYGEWALPFVAGRFAIKDRHALKWIAMWVVGLLLLLGAMSCIEAMTKVNPFETLFGNRPQEMFRRSEQRFGLKRAFGPTMHPIFLGMMIAILMPWLVTMWQSFESRRTRGLTILAGIVALAGTVFTGSRTPVLTILAAASLILLLKIRMLRWPLGLTLALAISGFVAYPYEVTDALSRWTGGVENPRLIEIDGEGVVSSSSRTRLHVVSIYSEALIKAGPFGYGSNVTSGFPLRIPNMEGTFKSANLFKTVDNAYVLLTLRFGWVGGVCLVILFLTAIGTGLSLYFERPDQLFPGVVGCMLIVIACFSLLLVFMSYDFGLPILWSLGVLSGLASARIANSQDLERAFRSN